MASGGRLERDVCYLLTDWWSGGKAEDVLFWRTRNSGGRSTIRARKGKSAKQHAGDIEATCEIGRPLTRLITFECKNGYNGATLHGLLDRTNHLEGYLDFFEQSRKAAQRAGTPYWVVIHHRRKREMILTVPIALWDALECSPTTVSGPIATLLFPGKEDSVVSCHLKNFLISVSPVEIRRLSARLCR